MSNPFLEGGVLAGSTSVSIPVLLRKTADNTELPGIAYNTSGNLAYYQRQGAAPVAITLATLASPSAAWSSGGFVEEDATNMKGLYRLDVPNAAFAAGADNVVISFFATGAYFFYREYAIIASGGIQDPINLGDFKPSAVFDFEFSTMTRLSGVALSLAGTPVLSIYKDNSTVENTTCVTALDADWDGKVGLNHARVDLSQDTAFAVAGNYSIVLTTGTVGGVNIAPRVVAHFSIDARGPRRAQILDVLLKYNTAQTLRFPIWRAGGGGLAASTDWTPVNGDAKLSKDGAAEGSPAATIAFVNGSPTLAVSGADTSCAEGILRIIDSAPKVVDDVWIRFRTFGNASAYYPDDVSVPGTVETDVLAAISTLSDKTPDAAHYTNVRGDALANLDRLDVVLSTRLPSSGYTVPPTVGAIRAEVDASSTQLAAIKARTDNLPDDPADASDVGADFTGVNDALTALNSAIAALSSLDTTNATALATAITNVQTAVGDVSTSVTALPSATVIADALLIRHVLGGSNGDDTNSVSASLTAGLMKFAIAGDPPVLTVKKPDGTTLFTRTLDREVAAAIRASN